MSCSSSPDDDDPSLEMLTAPEDVLDKTADGFAEYQEAWAARQAGKHELAFQLAEEAAEMGLPEAEKFYGFLCLKGDGCEFDAVRGRAWVQRAAEHGESRAIKTMAEFYREGLAGYPKNPVVGVDWLEKGAKKGFANCQFSLGCCFENGEGRPRDMTQAVKWFKAASDQDFGKAHCRLAMCHREGYGGLKMDKTKAAQLYERSTRHGCPGAMSNLGQFYLHGIGVPKDAIMALQLFEEASRKGEGLAMWLLGRLYKDGIAVRYNDKIAFELFRRASEKGCGQAMWELYDCYSLGSGVKPHEDEALYWADKALQLRITPNFTQIDRYRMQKEIQQSKKHLYGEQPKTRAPAPPKIVVPREDDFVPPPAAPTTRPVASNVNPKAGASSIVVGGTNSVPAKASSSSTPQRKRDLSSCVVCKTTALKAGPLKRCSKCKAVAYCTSECQKRDWDSHKHVCAELAKG